MDTPILGSSNDGSTPSFLPNRPDKQPQRASDLIALWDGFPSEDAASEVELAFWRLVEKQAAQRGQILTTFARDVAKSILAGGLAALDDHTSIRPRYQVVSAPTGSGKSSYAWALLAALIEADAGASGVFLCDTIAQCDDTFRELAKLIPASELAIWTGAHDARKGLEEVERLHGFRPVRQFYAEDLPSYRVVVATHKFYRDKRGNLAREYDGRPRTLTVVDERPQEVSIFDIDQGDVAKVRDWMVGERGAGSAGVEALKGLHAHLGEVWETERTSSRNFRSMHHSDLAWFSSGEAEEVVRNAGDALPSTVIGFAQALAQGYAFMARLEAASKGGRFVGYRMDLPIMPGTILLDATSDIDGVSSLVAWRRPVPSPRVSYANLEVSLLAPPSDVVGPRRRLSTILKTAAGARPYADWIRRVVVENTIPGEKVLVVVHKALLDHDYLPDSAGLGEGAFDLEGRKVAWINWGMGVGSNRWKEATTVFLFGEFHVPKRATVATTFGLQDQPAGPSRLGDVESPNSQDEALRIIRDGHLLRWEKQLAMRGNARNITADGVCGNQRLFVTCEFSRFMKHREALFPGATFRVDKTARRNGLKGAEALAALLMETAAETMTGADIEADIGVSIRKHGARLFMSPVVVDAMAARGWRYNRGGGRGNPSRFDR